MTCSCGNLQCYVCGESIRDYKHFEVVRKDGTKCPLHEKNDQRLDTKIRRAQADAVKKVLDEEEGLNEEDVKVDIPTVKPMNAQPLPPHLHQQRLLLHQRHQQLQQLQQQHQQLQQQHQQIQMHRQHLQRLHQQYPQQQQGLPPFGFIPNMPTPQVNWNIPAVPNVFPFQVSHICNCSDGRMDKQETLHPIIPFKSPIILYKKHTEILHFSLTRKMYSSKNSIMYNNNHRRPFNNRLLQMINGEGSD